MERRAKPVVTPNRNSAKQLNAGEILDRSANHVESTLKEQPLIQAMLMDTIGDVYRSMADFEKAEKYIRSALKIQEERLAWDDPNLATTLIHLGWLHQEKGQFDEAERLFQQALIRRTTRFGDLSSESLDAKFHLAALWMFEEDVEKAEPAFREIIEKQDRIRGKDNRDAAIARLSLAATLLESERFPEAILLSRSALKVLLSETQADQIFQVVGKFNKAFLLQKVRAYKQAVQVYQEGLKIAQNLFGADHPYLSFFFYEIGNVKVIEGDYVAAESNYRKALDLGRSSVGLAHPKAIRGVNALTLLLVELGRYEEARMICQELLTARKQAYGHDHVWVADALVSFSFITDKQRDYKESERLLREALGI